MQAFLSARVREFVQVMQKRSLKVIMLVHTQNIHFEYLSATLYQMTPKTNKLWGNLYATNLRSVAYFLVPKMEDYVLASFSRQDSKYLIDLQYWSLHARLVEFQMSEALLRAFFEHFVPQNTSIINVKQVKRV